MDLFHPQVCNYLFDKDRPQGIRLGKFHHNARLSNTIFTPIHCFSRTPEINHIPFSPLHMDSAYKSNHPNNS